MSSLQFKIPGESRDIFKAEYLVLLVAASLSEFGPAVEDNYWLLKNAHSQKNLGKPKVVMDARILAPDGATDR